MFNLARYFDIDAYVLKYKIPRGISARAAVKVIQEASGKQSVIIVIDEIMKIGEM